MRVLNCSQFLKLKKFRLLFNQNVHKSLCKLSGGQIRKTMQTTVSATQAAPLLKKYMINNVKLITKPSSVLPIKSDVESSWKDDTK